MVVNNFIFWKEKKAADFYNKAYYFINNNSKLESLYKIKMFIFKSC